MKNKEGKPLRVKKEGVSYSPAYCSMLCALLQSEATLVAAGKDSALPHYIAIVKHLEHIFDFSFEILEEKK